MSGKVRRQSGHTNSIAHQVAVYATPASGYSWPAAVEKMAAEKDRAAAERYAGLIWRARMPEHWLPSDVIAIADLAKTMVQRDRAGAQLDAEGLTIVTATGQTKAHPAAAILQGLRTSVNQQQRALGMTGLKMATADPRTIAGHARQLNAIHPADVGGNTPEADLPRDEEGRVDYSALRIQ